MVALAPRLVEEQSGCDAHVQRLGEPRERNPHGVVARAPHERPQALPLRAQDQGRASRQIGVPHLRRRLGRGGKDPQPRPLHLGEVAREIRDDREREVLDRARRGAADGRRDARRSVRGQDDTGRPCPLGGPADGPEVPRIRDLVEAREQRALGSRELIGVRVPVRLAEREHALVVPRSSRLGQLPFGLDLRAELAEPRLSFQRSLRDPQLEDLAGAAERLADRSAAVDLLPRHSRTYSEAEPARVPNAVAVRSRRPALEAAVAATLVALAVVIAVWAVDRALGENGVERADAKLAAALRASAGALDARAERAGVLAERLARSPGVQRALATHDRQRVAAVVSSTPEPMLVRVPGRFALGQRVENAIRRSASVGKGGRLGEITVYVPLDERLLRRIERPADTAARIDLVLVRGDRVLAGRGLNGRRLVLPSAEGGDVTAAGGRYRAAGFQVLATPRPTKLGALLPRQLVDSSGSRRRILVAAIATLVTLLLLALTVPELVRWSRRRGASDVERRRGLGPRSTPVGGHDGRDALALVGDALAATHDPEALLPVILGVAIEATGATGGRLVDGARELAVRGRPVGDAEPLVLPLGAEGEASSLYLYPPPEGFTDESRELARWLATQATIALENAHLHGLVKAQAVTDELTGLANRRRFMDVVTLELKRSERFESPLGLILVDLDDFKAVNDRFGHQTGDVVLRALSDVFRASLRDVDLAARIGGEEFAVLLPETDGSGAAGVAERLRATLAAVELEGPEGDRLGVTASFGVAFYPEAQSVDELLTLADTALYRAKAEGKNRVVGAPSGG
jgi:diguanylate cyclase (GGDEF)-like protein